MQMLGIRLRKRNLISVQYPNMKNICPMAKDAAPSTNSGLRRISPSIAKIAPATIKAGYFRLDALILIA